MDARFVVTDFLPKDENGRHVAGKKFRVIDTITSNPAEGTEAFNDRQKADDVCCALNNELSE